MGGKKRRRIAQEAKDTAAASLASAQGEQAKAMADVQSQKAAYENFQFENPYGNLSMENFAEDLTVNTQQADFQAQQGAQQRANIMQNLQGAAGGSGIAGLAQAMANQGQLQTQQISASIGAQEAANQKLAASQAGANQLQEMQGEQFAAGQRMKGGEMVARQEADRRATLLGIQASMAGGAAQAATSADQMSLQTDAESRAATTGAITSGLSGIGKAAISNTQEGTKNIFGGDLT